jgi:hypothetical protein
MRLHFCSVTISAQRGALAAWQFDYSRTIKFMAMSGKTHYPNSEADVEQGAQKY